MMKEAAEVRLKFAEDLAGGGETEVRDAECEAHSPRMITIGVPAGRDDARGHGSGDVGIAGDAVSRAVAGDERLGEGESYAWPGSYARAALPPRVFMKNGGGEVIQSRLSFSQGSECECAAPVAGRTQIPLRGVMAELLHAGAEEGACHDAGIKKGIVGIETEAIYTRFLGVCGGRLRRGGEGEDKGEEDGASSV
jgi:hypothetical protein